MAFVCPLIIGRYVDEFESFVKYKRSVLIPLIDLDGFHMGPLDDPIQTMIVCGSGRDVKLSIINGRVVMKDRKIPKLDLDDIKQKGQKYYDKMRKGYVKRYYQKLGDEQLLLPSFTYVERID